MEDEMEEDVAGDEVVEEAGEVVVDAEEEPEVS